MINPLHTRLPLFTDRWIHPARAAMSPGIVQETPPNTALPSGLGTPNDRPPAGNRLFISRARRFVSRIDRFAEISQLLKKMDRLVLRFLRTEPGAEFAAAWTASRIIRDLGSSAPAAPQPAIPAD